MIDKRKALVATAVLVLVLVAASPDPADAGRSSRRSSSGRRRSRPKTKKRGPSTASGKSCSTAGDCAAGEMCAYGKCKCPILFKGRNCKTVNPTRGQWCVTPFASFSGSGYNPNLNFTTCAVVGNSDSVKRKEWGREIVEHSVVIRFNEAPTVGFKKYVGDWHNATIRL